MSIRARTWAALATPPFTWFLFEQGLSALLHANCLRWDLGLAWGLASLALCAVSFRFAWPLHKHEGLLANPWLARLALALTGIFCLAIAFQTLAIAMVPACVG
ncbi:hypothetical protein [Novosphingobium sp. 9U]|uniref:hypothetical protein n=1 Tax=Novosphingobium sp. 9U TaxID=2653158 RepID=UPI0012F3C388|nr:hypothetical protein [Novosphingobium sp. 9U]VWX49420.1 conserved hypothetical protein [Novosphingobium sp. 9U]